MVDLTYFYVALILAGVLLFVIIRIPRHRYRQLTQEGWKKQQLGDIEGALNDYTAALKKNSAFSYAYFNRGYLHIYKQKFDEAYKDANQLIQIYPNSYMGYTLRADTHTAQKHYDIAFAEYQRALSLQLNSSERAYVYMRQGLAYLAKYDDEKKAADLEGASASFESSLQDDPKRDFALIGKGQVFARKKDYETALNIYTDAIQLIPTSAPLFVARSTIYTQLRNFDVAIADCTTAIKLRPLDVMAHNNRGFLNSVIGNFDQALSDCNQSLKFNPDLYYPYGSRGHTYFLMGRYQEALADFQKATEIKPDHKFAIAGEAITLHAFGKLEEAKNR